MKQPQDRYRLIEPLGAGGMSVVWRAYDEVLGRPVAVKRLATADDPRSRRRIQDEARAAALLTHPHIAAVHDFGHGPDGAPFVVMELVPGDSLETRLLDGPLTPAEALRLGGQLASALAAVHARGLVHHDVKPANVMLTPDGAKLVDFGISAIAGNDTEQLVGTPAYLAPERLRGVPPSPATDVYALGLVVYRMLRGTLPWPFTETDDLLHAHRKLAPEPLPDSLAIPGPVRDTIRRCLAKAPANRPTAAEVHTVLTTVPPQALTRRFTLAGSSRRRIVVAAAFVLAVGTGGLTAYAQSDPPQAAFHPAAVVHQPAPSSSGTTSAPPPVTDAPPVAVAVANPPAAGPPAANAGPPAANAGPPAAKPPAAKPGKGKAKGKSKKGDD